MTTAAPRRTTTAAELWRNWLPAVERLVPVPAEFRVATLAHQEAARELAIDEGVLENLVGAGFPAEDTPDGLRYDYHDVMNLGLQSGLGRSLAELGERQCMRLAAGQPESWLTERVTRLRLTAACSAAGCTSCVTVPAPAEPAPKLYEGRLTEWAREEAGSMVATVTTRGHRDAPRTGAVRRIHDDLLDRLVSGEYQYGWVPEALRARPAAAIEHRTVDCVVAAWQMQRWAEEAGVRARTRRGFLLGLVGVEHAWTEVFEEGRWLLLDPVLGYLGSRHRATHPEFADFTRGSVHNRLLAWDRSVDESLADHDCVAGGHVRVDCRQIPAARTPA
ncbi:transglutaminase domain-containing protein [Streptomyces cinnabarinus]|uniref:Transglutaminase domain-containing protein n=1 Tax=Streptomyces cinnabarinus TaxID=67287 RepID=A0ABY7KH62_9ACTN|nr:transglutaminase domain-containing protein [Streptomyces cinnabarinus]WAZ22910.1 transglutaminase domain-containing protein [Streptomyces cinnabarinus]